MDKAPIEFYREKMQSADVQTLHEIVATAEAMDEKTRTLFRSFLCHGENDLVRERLAGWLYNNQAS